MLRQSVLLVAVAGSVLAATAGCGVQQPAAAVEPLLATTHADPGVRPPGEGRSVTTGSGVTSLEPDRVDAAASLRSAADRLAAASFGFTLSDGTRSADGEYDAATGVVSLVRAENGRLVTVAIHGATLLLSGFVPDGAVLKVDAERLPPSHSLMPTASALSALRLVGVAQGVVLSGEGYAGSLDLTRLAPSGPPSSQSGVPSSAAASRAVGLASSPVLTPGGAVPDAEGGMEAFLRWAGYLVRQAGDRAGAVPFVATVDPTGRLASFRVVFPRAAAGRDLDYEFAVVAAGSPGTVAGGAGSGRVVEAPESVYQP